MKVPGLRRTSEAAGKEIFEITPVILGGSPTDLANKVVLSREQHIQLVRYWNGVMRELRRQSEHVTAESRRLDS
jgi:hypothetical protein